MEGLFGKLPLFKVHVIDRFQRLINLVFSYSFIIWLWNEPFPFIFKSLLYHSVFLLCLRLRGKVQTLALPCERIVPVYLIPLLPRSTPDSYSHASPRIWTAHHNVLPLGTVHRKFRKKFIGISSSYAVFRLLLGMLLEHFCSFCLDCYGQMCR